MKKDIVNLSKEEYEYLKSIDLNLTKETGIYFDYDLIMANIDKTPREIIQMDDTIDRRFLSWFDKLFASNLENFFGDYYKTNISGNKAPGNEKCPLNNKESEEYKDYIKYKKIFASSLRAMACGKAKAIQEAFNSNGNICQMENEAAKEYTHSMKELIGDDFTKPSSDYIVIDNRIELYKSIIKDRKKPKLASSTSFDDIIQIVEKSLNKKELTDKEAEIDDYIADTLGYDSVYDAINPRSCYYVDNYLNLIFIIRALADSSQKKDYSKVYKQALSQKKNIYQDVDEVMPKGYKNTEIGKALLELDAYIVGINVSNIYQEYSQYLINNAANFGILGNNDGLSKEEIATKNQEYFDRKDHGKEVAYQVDYKDGTYEFNPRLTDSEIDNDKKTISDVRNKLENDNAKQAITNDLIAIIDKLIDKKELNESERALLTNNGIAENLSEDELKAKKSELNNTYNNLHNEANTRANKLKALVKASDIIGYKKKAAKNQQSNTVENPSKETGNTDPSAGNTEPSIDAGTGTGSNLGDSNVHTDPEPISMKLGDNIGSDSQILNGYKTSYDAYNGVNSVRLNQDILNDGNTIIKNLFYNNNGKMVKLPINQGEDIADAIARLGIDPKDVVANLTNASGTGRAWASIGDVAKTLGRSL